MAFLRAAIAGFRVVLTSGKQVFWIFAALVLLIILSVTITHRGPVRIAGCVSLAAILGWGLYQRLNTRPESHPMPPRGKSASPALATQAMPIESIGLSNLELTGGGAPFELRGSITNRSADTRLTALTLQSMRRDCYEGAIDPSGCVVIWEDQHWIRWAVPAGETREFVETIWAHTPVPRARGTIKDEFELLGATGVPGSSR
jgi:hypothetical protein